MRRGSRESSRGGDSENKKDGYKRKNFLPFGVCKTLRHPKKEKEKKKKKKLEC